MIFLGHIGVAVTATQLYIRRSRRYVDLRKIAVISMLPDLIDKPLAFIFPEEFGYHTRLHAHSLLFCALMIPVFIGLRRRLGPPLICWLALFSHLLLDRMWVANQEMLFWPLLGEPRPQKSVALEVFNKTSFQPWAVDLEIVGLAVLFAFAVRYRLYRKENLITLMKSGTLEQ